MSYRSMLATVIGITVLAGCIGQGSGVGDASTHQPSSPGAAPSAVAAATTQPVQAAVGAAQPALVEDLNFTGQLSGHVTSATLIEGCEFKPDPQGRTFQATISLVLADGTHGFRVTVPEDQGAASALRPTIDVSPAGSPKDFVAVASFHATQATVTVTADGHGGTIDGDYVKGPPAPPLTGFPGTQQPSAGHMSGTWRCA